MYPYASSALWPFMGWPLVPTPRRVDSDKVPAPTPPTGLPKTGDQSLGWAWGAGGAADNWLSGYADAPPGNYRVWRMIAKDSTINMAIALVVGPILSSGRAVEVRQQPGQQKKRKGGPIVGDGVITDPLDKRAEFIDGAMSPLLFELIEDMATSLFLGHKPFEQVWDVKGGMEVIKEFRPLRNEATVLQVDNLTGKFLGLRHNNIDIFGSDAFNFVNETEDGYVYGKSRADRCREDWWMSLQLRRKLYELAQKATGLTFGVEGPVGTGKQDSNGNYLDGPNPANDIANEVLKMRPFWMPSTIIPFDFEQVNNPDYLKSWTAANEAAKFKLHQFDWGNTAPAATAILAELAELGVRMMHAFCRPQREAMEGQHGTKAEAGIHGQIGVMDSDLRHGAYCRAISRGPINDLLERNFGPDARDSVYLEASPIQDAQKQFLSQLLTDSLTNPQNSQDLYGKLDKAKIADDLDIPIREDADANEEPKPIVPPTVPPKDANGSANGNGRMNGNGVKLAREDEGITDLLSAWSDGEGMPIVEPEVGGRFSREDAPAMPDIVVNMPAPTTGKVTKRITLDKDGDGRVTGGTVTEETEENHE